MYNRSKQKVNKTLNFMTAVLMEGIETDKGQKE